jgi:hypothetical protein
MGHREEGMEQSAEDAGLRLSVEILILLDLK